jgi:phosphatidylserine decarboxylase
LKLKKYKIVKVQYPLIRFNIPVNQIMHIYKKSYPLITRLGIILVGINILFLFQGWQPAVYFIIPAVSVIFFVLISLFFRVQERKCIRNENIIYSPADGTVVAVEEVFEGEYLKTTCTKVSIFMSIFNIHQNIIPVSGKVLYYKYHPGKNLVAYHNKASSKNEHTSVVIETNAGLKLMVRQIAGFVARRIICNVKENDNVEQGGELGFILFGSRVDIYLPATSELIVKTGDKVKANISPIAEIAHKDVNKECKWYLVCPLRIFNEQGKLDKSWIKLYCKGAWLNCIRYCMEENGESHPDNMMPDGSIDDNLTKLD